MGKGFGSAALLGCVLSLPVATAAMGEAQAQERPSPAPPPAPAPVSPVPPNGSVPATLDDTTPVSVPADLLHVQPGGLTAEQVGMRAANTSWSAKASRETLRGAAARVDEAWASFLPRLSGVGKYTRLSAITPPNLGTIVATSPNPPTLPNGQLAAERAPLRSPFSFPILVDNWLLQGTISVPISDYFLRIDQTYTAATRSLEAARWDVATARAVAQSNGRIAYYTWLNARGSVIVAIEALNDQKTHLRDARNQFSVGNASKADVLSRGDRQLPPQTSRWSAPKNLPDLSEKQLRVAMHASDEEILAPGEDLDSPVAPVQGNVKQMEGEALSARPEIKSAIANASAAREQASAAKASRYPSFSAHSPDGIYANPNPRIFSAEQHLVSDVGSRRAAHVVAERHPDGQRHRGR